MFRADTSSLPLCETPVGPPLAGGLAKSLAWPKVAFVGSGDKFGLQVGFFARRQCGFYIGVY
jgi:hypothetical protein